MGGEWYKDYWVTLSRVLARRFLVTWRAVLRADAVASSLAMVADECTELAILREEVEIDDGLE